MGGTDDWGGYGPTSMDLLREEYPDLMDKWREYHDKLSIFRDVENHLNRFSFIERLLKTSTYIYMFEQWEKYREEYLEAEKEYNLLEKLLRSY